LVDENLKEVGVNEIGEFLIKAPTVTPGYWNNPEATEKAIVDGWFKQEI
jgi:fatty-acyl-CoA synthase